MESVDSYTLVRQVIGRNIRTLRTASGQNQTKFAAMIGVNRSYINQIESGKMNASVNILVKIADGLDAPLASLFEGLDGCAPRKLPADNRYAVVRIPNSRRD